MPCAFHILHGRVPKKQQVVHYASTWSDCKVWLKAWYSAFLQTVLVPAEHWGWCIEARAAFQWKYCCFFCLFVFLDPELQSALLLFRPHPVCVVHRRFQFRIHVFTQVGWSHGNLCASAAGSLWWGNLSLPLLWSERSVGLSVAPGDCCPHVAEGPIGCTPDLQDVISPPHPSLA